MRFSGLVAAFAAVLLGGCWPTVLQPIGASAAPPEALFGTWVGRMGDPDVAPAYLHILASPDGGIDLFMIRTEGSNEIGWSQFHATYGEVAGTQYLTGQGVEAVDSKDIIPAEGKYTLVRIALSGDTLDIYFGSTELFNAAVKSGEMAGDASHDYTGPDLTGSAADIEAFLADGDPKALFPEHFAALHRAPALTAHP
ncbi:MAG: hypothetical protein GC199_07045 [Alphaproteobacteria bacterium]|nr:hypothetical protein [Alphaproteobacteria bacterium]